MGARRRLQTGTHAAHKTVVDLVANQTNHEVGKPVTRIGVPSPFPMHLLPWQVQSKRGLPCSPTYQDRFKTSSVRPVWVVRRAKSRFPKLLKGQESEQRNVNVGTPERA
jgi:hypothetical protein